MLTLLDGKVVSKLESNSSPKRHPCFDAEARKHYGRIHLPVAPKCNVQCKFCNRKYSCVNESRPGVTARVMTAQEALATLDQCLQKNPAISVVGIAGPGDPFANPESTLKTMTLVRKKYPDLLLCVSSNGLGILPHLDSLYELGVSHVTITVNAVTASIAKEIYAWISWEGKAQSSASVAAKLWEIQRMAIKSLSTAGIAVKVNTVLIPGINSFHIEEISRKIKEAGASIHNIIPLLPTRGTAFENIPEPSSEEIFRSRSASRSYLPQMEHCMRCRADAVGFLGSTSGIT